MLLPLKAFINILFNCLSLIFLAHLIISSVEILNSALNPTKNISELGVEVFYNLDEAIKDVDVINILRIQKERQQENFFPSDHEYIEFYQLTKERLLKAKPDVLIMHPGPMNRGIEISSEVADSPLAVINEQVTNGILSQALTCEKPKA